MKRGKYELKERAERQARTRQRIVEAAVALHRERGVAATTITEIAQRAGVQRLTVYNHFPDDVALLQGCSGHWTTLHPFPDSDAWGAIDDPGERLIGALRDLYAYYEETESMTEKFLRDAPLDPALAELLAETWHPFFEQVRELLARGWQVRGARRSRLLAAIALAIDFHTWQSLVRDSGLSQQEAIRTMVAAVRAAA